MLYQNQREILGMLRTIKRGGDKLQLDEAEQLNLDQPVETYEELIAFDEKLAASIDLRKQLVCIGYGIMKNLDSIGILYWFIQYFLDSFIACALGFDIFFMPEFCNVNV